MKLFLKGLSTGISENDYQKLRSKMPQVVVWPGAHLFTGEDCKWPVANGSLYPGPHQDLTDQVSPCFLEAAMSARVAVDAYTHMKK